MYINDKEIAQILGYKSLSSYRNSKKSKDSIDKLILELTKRIENKYNNRISDLKRDLIISLNRTINDL